MLRGIVDALLSANGDDHAYLLGEWVQFKLANGRGGEPAMLRRFCTFTDVVGCDRFAGWSALAFQLILATGNDRPEPRRVRHGHRQPRARLQ